VRLGWVPGCRCLYDALLKFKINNGQTHLHPRVLGQHRLSRTRPLGLVRQVCNGLVDLELNHLPH
jgi:hypothetical protein